MQPVDKYWMHLRNLFEFRDSALMTRVDDAFTEAGLLKLDNGAHAITYMNKNREIVKAFEDDPCYKSFVVVVHRFQKNPHFPRIRRIGKLRRPDLEGAYVVKMEPLEELTITEWFQNIGLHCFLLMRRYDLFGTTAIDRPVSRFFGNNPFVDSATHREVRTESEEWQRANPAFVAALDLVLHSKGKRCHFDFHKGNFMKRGSVWETMSLRFPQR